MFFSDFQFHWEMLTAYAKNGPNDMVKMKSGTATQILKKVTKSLLIHCFAHALNLLVGDMIRQFHFLDNIMYTAFEISNLIKLSPKKETMLDKLHHELAALYPGFRAVKCPWKFSSKYCR